MLRDCVCEGRVVHRRSSPVDHHFQYPVWMLCVDVDAVRARSGQWLSATRRLAPLSLRPGDFPRDKAEAGLVSTRDRLNAILAAKGHGPADRIFLLTQPRSWGWLFNPVSFYFCYRAGQLHRVVAEITNTPWDQVFHYVLDPADSGPDMEFVFPKRFHVSPFVPMDVEYRWRFRLAPDAIEIAMHLSRAGAETFFAGLYLKTEALSDRGLRRGALRYPLQSALTLARIYWQAFRLWLRRVPFYPHPNPVHEVTQQ